MELRVGGKFRLGRKIGSGSFGDIYIGTNVTTGEEVAIKLEKKSTLHPQLFLECRIYKAMQGAIGIPTMKWCETQICSETSFPFCPKETSNLRHRRRPHQSNWKRRRSHEMQYLWIRQAPPCLL